jgi:plastocyanin
MRAYLPTVAVVAAIAGPAVAADLTITVKGDDGMALADAVVVVKPAGGAAAASIRFSWPLVMSQQNIAFNPYVLIVPVGSEVAFPNKDKVRHHVYSFSAAKKFELKLYGQQAERTVVFDKAGIVPLGCNIHDQMIGYIYVTDSPYAAKTNAAGEAVIRGLPAGPATMTVWHPEMKARAPLSKPAPSGRDTVVLEMRPMSARHQH